MREIRFRGKDINTGEWVYGDLHTLCDRPHIHTKPSMFPYAGKRSFVDVETVGEFTGLVDRKGVEVYEGDILHVCEYDNLIMPYYDEGDGRFEIFTVDEIKGELRKEYTSAVIWDEASFVVGSSPDDKDVPLCCMFGDMRRSQPIFVFEVVGNIYDERKGNLTRIEENEGIGLS